MAIEKKNNTLYITIENVNQADALALMKMFEYMEYLGKIGSSRWCSFFADGDGSFRPKISYVYPQELPEVPEVNGIVKYIKAGEQIIEGQVVHINGHLEGSPVHSHGDFAIDPDTLAWRLFHD